MYNFDNKSSPQNFLLFSQPSEISFYRNLAPNLESKKTKVTYDPIHKEIAFPIEIWKFIDTPEFQRLRRLKQLSTVCYINPLATHTRFEHCIGTGHLSGILCRNCFKNFEATSNKLLYNNKAIKDNDYFFDDPDDCSRYTKLLTMSGLFHDISHGPFSHTFEGIIHDIGYKDYDHEKYSKKVIEHLVDFNHLDLQKDDRNFIYSIITGEKNKSFEYPFLYEIVANKKNSLDVDKFDYIERDIFYTAISFPGVDVKRIIDNAKVINNNLCYSEKIRGNIESVFQARRQLHRKVYLDPTNLVCDSMIKDALILCKDYFKWGEVINDVEKFLGFDDNVAEVILTFGQFDNGFVYNYNTNIKVSNKSEPYIKSGTKESCINEYENLEDNDICIKDIFKASKIMKDLYSRNLYDIIGQVRIPSCYSSHPVDDKESFVTLGGNPKDEFYVSVDDIDLRKEFINYGFKDKNPHKTISYYDSWGHIIENNEEEFKKMSLNTPLEFQECFLHCFCKDKKKIERATKIFEIFKESMKKIDNQNNKNELEYQNLSNKKEIENLQTYGKSLNVEIEDKKNKFMGKKRQISNFNS